MASRCKGEYCIYNVGGTDSDPWPEHWTVFRKDSDGVLTLSQARKKAENANRKESKARWARMSYFRNIFDQKALKEFQRPEGMQLGSFAPGQKVYAVRSTLHNPACAKGIVYATQWNSGMKCWQYEVVWYVRLKDAPLGCPKNQYRLESKWFLESELFNYYDKSRARDTLIDCVAKIYKWWADFEYRLQKLKSGDLEDGEGLS